MLSNLLADETAQTTSFDWGALLNAVVQWMTTTGIRLVIAIVIMIISFKIVNLFGGCSADAFLAFKLAIIVNPVLIELG